MSPQLLATIDVSDFASTSTGELLLNTNLGEGSSGLIVSANGLAMLPIPI
jgi:hypothetical protein